MESFERVLEGLWMGLWALRSRVTECCSGFIFGGAYLLVACKKIMSVHRQQES